MLFSVAAMSPAALLISVESGPKTKSGEKPSSGSFSGTPRADLNADPEPTPVLKRASVATVLPTFAPLLSRQVVASAAPEAVCPTDAATLVPRSNYQPTISPRAPPLRS